MSAVKEKKTYLLPQQAAKWLSHDLQGIPQKIAQHKSSPAFEGQSKRKHGVSPS